MLAKLSVDQALMKARSHVKNYEITKAKDLYQAILVAFPKNIRAQQGLEALGKFNKNNKVNNPPQNIINQLVNLYNQGQLSAVIEQTQILTKLYPQSFIVWNFLGAANMGLNKVEHASDAFEKVVEINPNYADGFNNLGSSLRKQGKLDKALDAFNKALTLKPDYAEALNNIGNTLKYQGNFDKAVEAYKKSISIKPDYADAYNNMGLTFQDQKNVDEAINAFNTATLLKPDFAEAYNNLATILQDIGRLEEAIYACKKSICIRPNYPEAYNNLGLSLQCQGKFNEAIDAFNKAISLNPNYAEIYKNMGDFFQDQGKFDESMENYKKALSIKPEYTEVYNEIGNVFRNQGKLDKSLEAYNKAISLKPNYAEAYNNLGISLNHQGNLDKAVEAYEKSILLKPDYADAYNNIGLILKDLGRLDESLDAYNKALSLKPDFAEAHQNMSFTLLNSGKLKEGLDKYEWRWKTQKLIKKQRKLIQPLWDGKQNLHDKTILLWSEQGIGDTLNWTSCLSFISTQAKHCILECQPKLVPLLKRSFPNVEIKPEDRSFDTKRDDFDFHLPLGSLYKHFIDKIEDNDSISAHLVPDPKRVNFWRERLSSIGNGPYIGIGWKTSNISPGRKTNNSFISDWSSVLKIPKITLINLQYKDFEEDLTKIEDEFGVKVHNFDDLDHFDNIDDVAALCAALDMVISIKTTVPFISGGVGTSTKIANWQQSSWNNILLNPLNSCVDIFERNIWEPWDGVFKLIAKNITKLKNNSH